MKRINTPTPEESTASFKPIFGIPGGNPPFYDPNDIHEHIWKRGKLGIEEDPKSPTFSKEKINIRDCEYCKICHKINDVFLCNFEKTEYKTIYTDYNVYDYTVKNKNYDLDVKVRPTVKPKDILNPGNHEHLYRESRVLTGECVVVSDPTSSSLS